jgi:hypothetical protein
MNFVPQRGQVFSCIFFYMLLLFPSDVLSPTDGTDNTDFFFLFFLMSSLAAQEIAQSDCHRYDIASLV